LLNIRVELTDDRKLTGHSNRLATWPPPEPLQHRLMKLPPSGSSNHKEPVEGAQGCFRATVGMATSSLEWKKGGKL
jgi:hypothetical protein